MNASLARTAALGASALGMLQSVPAEAAARAIAAAGDVVLVVDAAGIIVDIASGTDEIAAGVAAWLGQAWRDVACADSRVKVEEMLADAAADAPPRWRLINHGTDDDELPLRVIAVPANAGGTTIAIGRDMRPVAAMQQRLIRAQQAMERDTMSLRQVEARYRLLFETAGDAVIVVDTATQRIVEANPAARRLAGDLGKLEGQAFSAVVHPDDRDSASAVLGAAAAAEQARPARIRLVSGIDSLLAATLFRQDRATFLLLRLTAFEGAPTAQRSLADVLDRIPDPFVLTDADLTILTKNAAFLELVHQPRGDDARGVPLGRYLGRPGIDLGLLAAQLREHGQVRNFTTVIRDTRGGEQEVEVSAVGAPDGEGLRYGFTVRPAARRIDPGGGPTLPRSVEQLTELVGRVSLKEIVRESTDLIERLCIEAALAYTADNRASAAEILGLSRQSLYSKLHRHGLGNLVPDRD